MSDGEVRAVLLDMGGVILHMAGSRGFPMARLDWRGRQAMVQRVRAAGGRVNLESLEEWVFAPWQAEYARRALLGVEADWRPHLDRLRKRSRCQITDLEILSAWFKPYGDQLEPLAGATEAVAELGRSDVKLALVSNIPLPGELYVEILDRFNLTQHFDTLIFSYDVGTRKPSPAMLRQAMATLEVEPSKTVMVGDRRDRDIAAGRLAGTRTVWIRSDDGGGAEPDASIAALADLPALLASIQR